MKTANPPSLLASSVVPGETSVSTKPADIKARYWFPEITGWFQECEALHLFTAVQLARPSRILEIGTFYGRSTATICSALAASRQNAEFISYDLDFRSEAEFQRLFAAIHRVAEVHPPPECNEAFARGMSTLEYARLQLDRYNFLPFVELRGGDFRWTSGTFEMIFADVLHDTGEIEANLPAILGKLEDDGVLAVHDMTDENLHTMQKISPRLRFISQSVYLGLFRFER
jgi:predicted O-methyltransferase YrrM